MRNITVIIDNGHGCNTRGKCSPDGKHREWEWTRKAARRLLKRLTDVGISSTLLVPEDEDIDLRTRCRRANDIATSGEAILISIHNNASGDGSAWQTARGWCVFVAPNASAKSQRLAYILNSEAAERGLTGNRSIPPCGYLTASFAICRDTKCPAVLTENLFQDNSEDIAFLASDEGLDELVDIHFRGIIQYIKEI